MPRLFLALLLALLVSSAAAMQFVPFRPASAPAGGGTVTILDAAAGQGDTDCSSANSFAYTVSAGADILVAYVSNRGAANTLTAITYGGQALTQLDRRTQSGVLAGELRYLVDPPTGSNTFSMQTSGSDRCAAILMTFDGVDTGTPWGTAAGSTGIATACSVDVTDTATGEIIAYLQTHAEAETVTATAPAVKQLELQTGANYTTTANTAPGDAATVTVGSSWTTNDYSVCSAASLQAAAGGGGGVVASDDFNGVTGTALATHDPNWTIHAGTYELEDNGLRLTASATQGLAYYAATYADDQYAQLTLAGGVADGIFVGPAVRVQAGAASGYDCVADVDTVALREWTTGTPADLTTTPRTQTLGEVIRLEASGTGLSCLIDSVEVLSTTDATHASGNAGFGAFSSAATKRADDWEGGNN